MSYNKNKKSPFAAVISRELNRMVSRRLYFGVCIILPLFSIIFMATIFGSGQMENMPIGIVDLDQTASSRKITRTIAAVPTFNVAKHYSDLESARKATESTEIYGYLLIPNNFESDVLGGRQATLSYFYHYALLSAGTEIYGAFKSTLLPLSLSPIMLKAISLGSDKQQIQNFLMPVSTQSHPLYNPDLDYSVYLSNPFFFVFLQVILILLTVYIIGSERKFHTDIEWLQTANMNIVIAILGKLLPYTIIFCIMGIFSNYILFGVMDIPHSAGFLSINIATVLFIIATQSLAVFVFSLFPAVGIIMSIGSMLGSLGATLAGVTFPTAYMFTPVYMASFLFPIRHLVLINQNLLYGDYGFAYVWQNYATLLIYPMLALLLLPRLKKLIVNHKYADIE